MARPLVPSDPFIHGSLTDVAGLHVGHFQRRGRGWQTGTTAIIVPDGAVAAVDVRGGGPGTRETDALNPHNLVDRIHGICLGGGSAYGLAAADGVMTYLESRRLGIPVGPDPEHVVPVVPAAVIFDLGRGGGFANRPTAEFGRRAAKAARTTPPKRGAIGAGTGALAGGLQGGVGMASQLVDCGEVDVRVAALAVVNASGSMTDPRTGLPWVEVAALRRPTAAERRTLTARTTESSAAPLNTTVGVVATDAALSRPETERLAMSAHDGLARSVRPAHSLIDGDTIFGLSLPLHELENSAPTLARGTTSRAAVLDRLYTAAAEVFAIACVDALLNAETIGVAPAYREVCPSSFRATRF